MAEHLDPKQRILEWLSEAGFTTEDLPAQQNGFALKTTDLNRLAHLVTRDPAAPNLVLLQTALDLTEQQRAAFAAIPESRRQEFFWSVRLALLQMGAGAFGGFEVPFRRVELRVPIYLDGLTQDNFMSRFSLLQRATLLVMAMVNRELNLQQPWES